MDGRNYIMHVFLVIFMSLCGRCVPDKSMRNDMEIVAKVHLDRDFMRRMEENMQLEEKVMKDIRSLDTPLAQIGVNNADAFLQQIINKRTSRKWADNDKNYLEKYEQRVKKQGLESIKAVAEHLQRKLEISTDIVTPILNNICFQYVTKLKSYFDYLTKKKPYYDIDKEYVVLDMVNIASTLLNSVEKTLFNQVLAKSNKTTKEDKQILTETLNIYSMNNKKKEMQHICKTMTVCRPYPGFSDHFAKILSEVLKLYDVKFQYFLVKATQLLNNKRVFFETILKEEIVDWFRAKTTNLLDVRIGDLREIISVLRSGISQKQRIINTKDDDVKIKTKAARILIDVTDKIFDVYGDEYLYMQIESIISAIQDWAASKRNDIESILNTLINQIVSTMKFDLNSLAKDELRTLGDIIFYGKAVDNEYMEEYLMEKGSKFVSSFNPLKKQLFALL